MKIRKKSIEAELVSRVVPTPNLGVVFIHGILSDSDTFSKMKEHFMSHEVLKNGYIGWVNYDFWNSMEDSADGLRDVLVNLFKNSKDCNLTLICHSMGGLIARIAVIKYGNQLPFVKRIIMLGTPNFGAIRPGQLGILAQLAMASFRKIYGLFSRKAGVLELTRVQTLMDKVYGEGRPSYATPIEYITIPGLFYHEERNSWQMTGNFHSKGLVAINLVGEWLNTLPGASLTLERPHDGIVEHKSVRMNHEDKSSEKWKCIYMHEFKEPRTYADVNHPIWNKMLTHTTLQTNDKIIDLVSNILIAGGFINWRRILAPLEEPPWVIMPGD